MDKTVPIAIVALLILMLAFGLRDDAQKRDDTDPPDGASGLIIKTDCLSGRQYLSTARGGLTPRLDADGNQIVRPCTR